MLRLLVTRRIGSEHEFGGALGISRYAAALVIKIRQLAHGAGMTLVGGDLQEPHRLDEIDPAAITSLQQQRQIEHRSRLPALGGLGIQPARLRVVPRNPFAFRVEERQARHAVGIALLRSPR